MSIAEWLVSLLKSMRHEHNFQTNERYVGQGYVRKICSCGTGYIRKT